MMGSLSRIGRASWFAGAVVVAIGCASAIGEDESEPLPPEAAAPEAAPTEAGDPGRTAEQVLAEWRGALDGTLAEHEQSTILSLLAAQGIPEEELDFRGRIVTRGGDGHWFADEILAARDSEGLIEKGLVLRDPNNGASGDNNQLCYAPGALYQTSCPVAPFDLANASGANLSWKRPDVTAYFLIGVDLPAHFTGANGILAKAANLIANGVAGGSGDCLNSPNALFSVQTLSSYNAQPAFAKSAFYELYVFPSTNICPGGGCATLPREQSTDKGIRLAFGPGIALPTSLPNDTYGVGIAIHEILHAMGFAHSDEDAATTFKIPGTPDLCSSVAGAPNQCGFDSAELSNGSVMKSGLDERGWDDWVHDSTGVTKIPPGDVNMIKKLYAGSCEYQSGFRTVTPCGPNGILHSSGTMCCLGPCNKCGGAGCGSAPGNGDRCCTAGILGADKPCGPFDAPCVIR